MSNCQCSLFSKKHPIIRIFCISVWLAVPITPDKWILTVFVASSMVLIVVEVKVKINFTLKLATKAQRRNRGIALLFH
jgi:hypothetical protein